LDVLLDEGPDAVAVQPIARRLGATKGSFYWHFASRDELLRAALARWEIVATDDVITEIEASTGSPAEKVKRLFAHVTASSGQHPGQLQLLGCAGQPDVAAALERTTTRRIVYVSRLLRDTGLTPAVADLRATLAYAAFLGYAQLAHTTPGALPGTSRARKALIEELAAVLLG
jgi:AcrR family transcriptional regulator